MFRVAAAGSLERALRTAGFANVHAEALTVERIWSGTPEELWAYQQQEVSTLCHSLFDSIPSDLRAKVDAYVVASLSRFQSGGVVKVPVNLNVVAGDRPSRGTILS